MAVELHLPDLPEVPLGLGPAAPRPPQPWHRRVREALATYLPLLLMAALASATWWLVKSTPGPETRREAQLPAGEPDYTMRHFVVERFDAAGRLEARLEGDELRHYPDADRVEVDQARMRSIGADGRVTLARAKRALTNGDGSEVQLIGDARVDSTGPRGEVVQFRGEFLHAFLNSERLRSHLPVLVTRDGSELRAATLDYDHLSGLVQLGGPIRALLPPRAASRAAGPAPSAPKAAP
jgi:lipopolysaccharide export system protein LptC